MVGGGVKEVEGVCFGVCGKGNRKFLEAGDEDFGG
jgi:hypothetical protein